MTDEVQSSQNADDHRAAFNREDAVQLIIAGITAGTLDFPFSKGLNAESLIQRVQDKRKETEAITAPDVLLGRFQKEAATEAAQLARLDAIYFLTLQQTLMDGLTEKEAERIAQVAYNL